MTYTRVNDTNAAGEEEVRLVNDSGDTVAVITRGDNEPDATFNARITETDAILTAREV